MKLNKLTAFLLPVIMLISMLPITAAAEETTAWRTIYVSPSGSDTADGSEGAPFKTLKRAQEAVREINANMQGDIVVSVAKGEYYLDEPLEFRKADSGTNGHRVIWQGVDRPLITGAEKVTGWTESADRPGLYETTVEDEDRIMQIYVNGKKRYMARSNEFVQGVEKPEQYRTPEWYAAHPNDSEGDNYNWYDPETPYTYDGFYMSKEDIGFWENEGDILFQWERNWKTQMVPVEEILQDPDNPDQVKVRMERGLWQIFVSCNYLGQAMYPEGGVRFRIINAMELLDEPGEFYFNRATKKLYYMPEDGEDMATAEVHVPKNDMVATIYGNDYNDCIENIDFKGFDFSYYASDAVAEGYWGEQGTVVRVASGTQAVGRSGVLMYFCDNVNFYDNYFRGFDQLAICMQEGVYNCTVRGNAFSDLGDAAINIGAERHAVDNSSDVPANKTKASLLSDPYRYSVYTSYVGDEYANTENYIGVVRSGVSRGDQTLKEYYVGDNGYVYKNKAWHSDPVDAANGEKSYVMFDLYSKWTIDDIVLCWDDTLVSPEEKSNYEVLMSNDPSFADGTYVTVASQDGAYQGEVAEYQVKDTNKYRYVMLRTKGATPLGLSTAYILSDDMKPHVYAAKSKNITIDNNYMTRIGGEIPRACGVMVYYIDGLNLTNNHLYDIGYSGVEIGWGWSASDSNTTNVYCAYNYIDKTNQFLYDGGPIYTLSRQPNSVYEYNYVTNNIMGVNTLYQDNGTASTTWRYNVAEDGQYVLSPYTDGIIDNTYYTNYATHTKSSVAANGTITNSYEEAIPYAMGLPTGEAYDIMANAGLEKEYEYLIDLVPTGVDNGMPEEAVAYERVDDYGYRTTYNGMHKAEADNMLTYGKFGSEIGSYAQALEQRFRDSAGNYASSATNRNTVIMRSLMREMRDSVNRYSLDETIALIKNELDNARTISENCPCLTSFALAGINDTFGMMTEEDVAEFKEKLTALEAKVGTAISPYKLQLEAETLYNEVVSSKFTADITYVSTEGMADYAIDFDTKTATIYFEKGSSMSEKAVAITCSPGATLAVKLPAAVDLSKPIIVPVYCANNLSYKYWTVKGEYLEPTAPDYKSEDNWVSLRADSDNVSATADGGIVIKHSPFANMSKSYDAEAKGASFSFTPMSYLPKKSFSFIFGANSAEIDNTLLGTAVDHMELVFEDSLASLYLVKGGTRTLVKQANTTLAYNSANDISYTADNQGGQTVVSVTLNGEKIFNELVSAQLESAYFGFSSEKISIKIS